MSVSLICVALLALLVILLGFNVSMVRARTETMYGAEPDPAGAMYKAVRAHGNTTEYAPLLALLIYILGQAGASGWVVWAMVLATFSRYLFAAGIILPATMAQPHPLRFIGSLGTYLSGLALIVALLLKAMG
ncbi:MAG: MAPEG family protein [Halioglobus sp.]|nr:MAPEG family protein [Halioglobus sp.]